MGTTPQYTYTVHESADLTDDEIGEIVAFNNIVAFEAVPEDPPTPTDQAIASQRAVPERYIRTTVLVRSAEGDIIGSTGLRIDPDNDDNPDVISGSVIVRADHRRNGVGTELLRYFVALCRREERDRILGSTNGRLPSGEVFAQTLGMEAKQAMHVNHLVIADVDRGLMDKWVADGPQRAEDYEIFGWDGDVPEEHMVDFLDAVLVMNTAPRDDLEINDFTLTAEEIREGEKQMHAIGFESWQLVARRKSDGAWAGIHNVMWNPAEPDVVHVGATGVRPEHRGHALGKWLKAVMTLRVMDERPNVTEIRTGNADSNDAMLGINKEMGYKPWISATTWEIATDAAEDWLKNRGLELPAV